MPTQIGGWPNWVGEKRGAEGNWGTKNVVSNGVCLGCCYYWKESHAASMGYWGMAFSYG